jgi:hypothetical protein
MRRLFLLALAGCVGLLVAGRAPAAPHAVLAAEPISRMDLPWWRARHEAVLQRLKSGEREQKQTAHRLIFPPRR